MAPIGCWRIDQLLRKSRKLSMSAGEESMQTGRKSASRALIRLATALLGMIVGTGLALPDRASSQPYTDPATALQDYVEAEDDAYDYALVESRASEGYSAHLLRMTSQEWREPGEARPLIWRHWLVVVVPDNVSRDTGALVVAGGSRTSGAPSFEDDEIRFGAQLAVLSETVVAVLTGVPYQPLAFADEPFPHSEDALVAYSWNRAVETGDYSWPAYLPMVKASVRAMDTMQDFVPQVAPAPINQFVVVGASKRGAAAWLTAASDPRVRAVAPMVIDILNFSEQMEHHLAVYGEYAPAIADYVRYGLVQRVDTPDGEALLQVIDPYAYLDALDMPKYIINSTGDQFFPPDSSQFYLGDLKGESLLRYVPNSDHSLGNTQASLIDAVSGLFGWYLAIVGDLPRPAVSWQRDGDSLTVQASPPPLAARLWQATNPQARDFRIDAIGTAWQPAGLAPVGEGTYAVSVPPPQSGWTAYFVELVYSPPRPGLCEVYSTRVFVTPEVRPFEGTDPQLAAGESIRTGGDPAAATGSGRSGGTSSLFDDIFASAARDLHGRALDEAFEEGDLGNRAIRYCYPRDPDELDEALELYARLGFGKSVDGALSDVWADAREEAGDIIDDVDKGIGQGIDEADAFIDDGIDETDAFIDSGAQEAADFVDDVF
jgi:PhoPQ-activated pathogenicity-related protein